MMHFPDFFRQVKIGIIDDGGPRRAGGRNGGAGEEEVRGGAQGGNQQERQREGERTFCKYKMALQNFAAVFATQWCLV